MVRKLGIPPENLDPLRYSGPRFNLTPVVEATRRPAIYDRNYSLFTFWRVNAPISGTGNEGEIWYLSRFADSGDISFNAGDAVWLMLGAGTNGAITNLRTDDGNLVAPLAGIIDVDGIVVANATNAKPLFTDGATANTARWELQVAAAITGAPADTNDAGIASFNDTHFDVDANGYVSLLGGGQAIDQVQVDFNTAPGVNPVSPDVNGLIQIFGNTVTNATNTNTPVATHSRALNQFHIDVQLSTAVSPTPADPFDVGLASFSNVYFTVDGNGFTELKIQLLNGPIGTTWNLGFSYSSPTFTVHASDGSALSATNPAYVVVQSKSVPGEKILYIITANLSFDDDSGTSDLTGNTWQTTVGVAWNVDMPFFLYAVANDSESNVTLAISRIPHLKNSPSAARFAISGSAVATTQGSFFGLDSGITVADYDSNPTISIGSFRMRKNDAANDDWTVQAINSFDGIGNFNDNQYFTMVPLQFGATGNIFFSTVGGDTIPNFQQVGTNYIIHKDGWVDFQWNADSIVTTSGAGAGILRATIPFAIGLASTTIGHPGNIQWRITAANTFNTAMPYSNGTTLQYVEMIRHGAATAKVTPGDWTTLNGLLSITVSYFANRG